MSKLSRHAAVRDVIATREVSSQEELRRALFRRGHRVTQATLSRDIHELGLVKTVEGYKVPQGEEAEIHLPSIERLIQEFDGRQVNLGFLALGDLVALHGLHQPELVDVARQRRLGHTMAAPEQRPAEFLL